MAQLKNQRLDISLFKKAEAEFLFETLSDLPSFITAFGFNKVKSDQTRQQDYKRNDNEHITLTKGHKRWVWCYPGQEKSDFSKTHGHLHFLTELGGAKDGLQAFAMMREYAKTNHLAAYNAFIDSFIKQNPGERYINLSSVISNAEKYTPKLISEPAIELNDEKTIDFNYQPAIDFSFILDRGITKDVLEHQLFKDRFGNASGPLGKENPNNLPTENIYEFENHLIIPLTNTEGRVVGLEAKNKLTEESFSAKLSRQYDNDNDLRRNPSKIFPGSSHRTSFWRSNFPENPVAIFVGEQPMDALSYFQLNQDQADVYNTLFITTGGAPTKDQIQAIKEYAAQYGISEFKIGFDNDQYGLRYGVNLMADLKDNEIQSPFSVGIVARADDQLHDLVFRATAFTDKFDDSQKAIDQTIQKFNVQGDYYPSIFKTEKAGADSILGVLSFPYNHTNAEAIFKLGKENYALKKQFTQEIIPQFKDLNDALQNKKAEDISVGKYILDQQENNNRIFVDSKYNLVLLKRFVSPDHLMKDVIGSFNPYAKKYFFKASNGLNLPDGINALIDRANRQYQSELNVVSPQWLSQILNQGIEVNNDLFFKNGNSIAKFDQVTKTPILSENYPHTGQEISAINWMSAALAKNVPIRPLLSLDYKDLYYHREDNKNLTLHEKTVTKNSVLAVLNPATDVWEIQQHDYPLTKDQTTFIENIKDNLDKLPDGVAIDNGTGQLIVSQKLVEISAKGIDKNYHLLTVEDTNIVRRMVSNLEKGLDPNRPGFIGRLNDRFTVDYIKNFKNRLTVAGFEQLGILESNLDTQRNKLSSFLEQYQEPYINLASENLILNERTGSGNKPIVQFDFNTQRLNWLAPIEELEGRAFNPYFFKAIQLFYENNGAFYNYIQGVKQLGNSLYYQNPSVEIGQTFDVNGVTKYVLKEGLPQAMVREIELFMPILKATKEEREVMGININGTSHLKEKKIPKIPLAYTPFFNKFGKLEYKTELELTTIRNKRPAFYARYIEAEIWNLNFNTPASNEKQITNSIGSKIIKDHNGLFKLARVDVAKYNPATDRLDIISPPARMFYSQLGLLEKNYVKDPANRKFSEYAFEQQISEPKLSNSEMLKQLSEMQITDNGSGEQTVHILHKKGNYFDKVKVAELKSNQLLVEKEFLNFSPLLEASLKYLAEQKKLLFIETEFKQAPAPKIQMATPNLNISKGFDHQLELTDRGVLKALTTFPSLRDIVSVEKDTLVMKSILGSEFKPFYNDPDSSQTVATKWPLERKFMIIGDSPEQLLLWSQKNYHIVMHDQVYMLSMKGIDSAEQRMKIDKLAQQNKVQNLVLVGSEEFQKNIGDFIKQTGIKVEQLSTLQKEDSLSNIKSLVNQYSLDKNLEYLDAVVSQYTFSPVKGIAIVPMESSSSKSFSIIAGNDKPSGDLNSVWISDKISTAKTIMILPSVREALNYLALNDGFNAQNAVIAFNNKPNADSVAFISNLLKTRVDLADQIYVANTERLPETLEQQKFPFRFKIRTTQYGAKSYQEEVSMVIENLTGAETELSLQKIRSFGLDAQAKGKHNTLGYKASSQGFEVEATLKIQ